MFKRVLVLCLLLSLLGCTKTPSTPDVSSGTEPDVASEPRKKSPGVITLFDAISGEQLWTFESESFATGFAVHGDKVVISSFGNLSCHKLSDGEKLWQVEGLEVLTFPPPVEDDVIYLKGSGDAKRFGAYSVTDGKKIWEVELAVDTDFVTWGENVSFLDWETGKGYTVKKATGEKLWEIEGKTLGTDGSLLFIGKKDSLTALDGEGKEVWVQEGVKPFEIRGVLKGVICLFADPTPMVRGQQNGLSKGNTSLGVSTKDGKVLYRLDEPMIWVGPWNIKTCEFALAADDEGKYWVIEPAGGKPVREFTANKKDDVEIAGDFLFHRRPSEKIEIKNLGTGELQAEIPLSILGEFMIRSKDGKYVVVTKDAE